MQSVYLNRIFMCEENVEKILLKLLSFLRQYTQLGGGGVYTVREAEQGMGGLHSLPKSSKM